MNEAIREDKDEVGILSIVFGVLGLSVGIIGLGVSIYFYFQTNKYKAPVFVVDPVRTEILSKTRVSEAPIRIIKSDGNEITSDLTSIRFYFWNDGTESIKREHILEKIKLTLDDPNAEIIDYRTLKLSRAVTDFKLTPNSDNPARSLILSFAILEKNDGVTAQVIYEGKPDAKLIVGGYIEDVKSIRTAFDIQNERLWLEYFRQLLPPLSIVLFITVVSLTMHFAEKFDIVEKIKRKIDLSPVLINFIKLFWSIISLVFILLFLLSLFVLKPLSEARENLRDNVVENVPFEVLPDH